MLPRLTSWHLTCSESSASVPFPSSTNHITEQPHLGYWPGFSRLVFPLGVCVSEVENLQFPRLPPISELSEPSQTTKAVPRSADPQSQHSTLSSIQYSHKHNMEPAVCDHIGCTPGLVCKENATNARRMDDASTPQSTSGPTPLSSPGGMVQAIDFRNIHWDSNHHPWTPDHPRGVAIVVRIPAHIPGQITTASFVNGLGIPLHVQTEDANVDQHGRADRV